MTYGYMPACCSYYTSEDLARMGSERNADKIKALEKEVETLKRKLEQMPTIELKRGKWVEHIMDYWCSECGGRVQKEQAKMYSKCPYCGAQMEEAGDDPEE